MFHQFLRPGSCPVGSPTNQELCGQARSETASKPSESRGGFHAAIPRSYPLGNGLPLRRPGRARCSRRDDPARRPDGFDRAARKGRGGCGEGPDPADSGKPSSRRGAKTRHAAARPSAALEARGQTRGAGQTSGESRGRPRSKGIDATSGLQARQCSVRQAAFDGRRQTRAQKPHSKIPNGDDRDGPAMRPEFRLAAESGVGKHTARQGEAPNVCKGRSAQRAPTILWPRGHVPRGLSVFRPAGRVGEANGRGGNDKNRRASDRRLR